VTGIVAVAKGAGLTNSHWVRDEGHFTQLLDRRFTEGGPLLPGVRIDDSPPDPDDARPGPDPQRLREGGLEPAAVAKRLISAPFAPKFVSGSNRHRYDAGCAA
jgi:hypothetical protein